MQEEDNAEMRNVAFGTLLRLAAAPPGGKEFTADSHGFSLMKYPAFIRPIR
jgi:hypothetical protein